MSTIRSRRSGYWQYYFITSPCRHRQESSRSSKNELRHIIGGKIGSLSYTDFTDRDSGKYAIVGESNSGKTTLTKIILGLLPGYSGKGFVQQSGAERHQYGKFVCHIAYGNQQVYLFQATVQFNITLGAPYTDEEVIAVVRKPLGGLCALSD